MSTDLAQYHDPKYWKDRMPRLEKKEGPGAPFALTPAKAGYILASIAQGIKPKPAFMTAGITPGTYNYYQQIKNYYHSRLLMETERAEQGESYVEPQFTREAEIKMSHPYGEYLSDYFELQEEAEQAAGLLFASARSKILTGGSNKTIVTRTRTRTRQAILNGQIVDLVDNESSTVEIDRSHPPKLPRRAEDL